MAVACPLCDEGLGDEVVDDVHPAVQATRIITAHNAAMRYRDWVPMIHSYLRRFKSGHSNIKAICFMPAGGSWLLKMKNAEINVKTFVPFLLRLLAVRSCIGPRQCAWHIAPLRVLSRTSLCTDDTRDDLKVVVLKKK